MITVDLWAAIQTTCKNENSKDITNSHKFSKKSHKFSGQTCDVEKKGVHDGM